MQPQVIEKLEEFRKEQTILGPDKRLIGHEPTDKRRNFRKGGASGYGVFHSLSSRPQGVTIYRLHAGINGRPGAGKQYTLSETRSWCNRSTLGVESGYGIVADYMPVSEYLGQFSDKVERGAEQAVLLNGHKEMDSTMLLVLHATELSDKGVSVYCSDGKPALPSRTADDKIIPYVTVAEVKGKAAARKRSGSKK